MICLFWAALSSLLTYGHSRLTWIQNGKWFKVVFMFAKIRILKKKCTTLWICIISTHLFQNHLFTKEIYFTTHQYWRKVSKIFNTFCLYFRLQAIMNLIFRTVRSENLMTSCRDKLYHHTISNKIKFNFLIILFGKMSSSKSLPSSGTESEIERMTDFEKFGL